MPAWATEYTATPVGATVVSTTTETVVATISGVNTDATGRRVRLAGQVNFTTGATTTALILRWRRNSLTGALVDPQQTDTIVAAAGVAEDHSIFAVDTPGEIANATYVLTVQQVGATANGQWNNANAFATVHN